MFDEGGISPRVSVIIPTYNRARFLAEAITSVLGQTFANFEIVVVDDGSTDNTREVVGNLKDSRVKYIFQANQGVSAARNTGITASRGEYIVVMGSDNVLFRDALEKSLAFMDGSPETGFCHGQFYTMDESGRPLRTRRPRGPRSTFIRDGWNEIKHMLLSDLPLASIFLVRRSCYEKAGLYNRRLSMSEDWDICFRLARHYSVGYLAEPLVKVRTHGNSMTARTSVDVVQQNHKTVLDCIFNDPELGPVFRPWRRKAYFGLYCLCARAAAYTGHKRIGLGFFIKAAITSPDMLLQKQGIWLLLRSGKQFLPWTWRNFFVDSLMALRLR